MKSQTVELHPAHVWDCDECGRENFCRGVPFEPSAEELDEMREESGDEFITGFWMTAPNEVTCAHCGTSFQTEDSRNS